MEKKPNFKHVFVLSTGRVGTVSLTKACKHVKNYTTAHESLSRKMGKNRLDYPEFHIEVDNRLSWILGRLDKKFGKNAFYVHMKRDSEAVAISQLKRRKSQLAILSAFHHGVLKRLDKITLESARDMVLTVNTNIESFLADKPHKMDFQLEKAEEDLPHFFEVIGADVDHSAALMEFSRKHNKSESPSFIKKKTNNMKLWLKYKSLNKRHK